VVTSAAAILSKSASKEHQSTVQAIRTTGEVLAQILSPIWVSGMLHRTDIVLIFQLVFMTLCLTFAVSSWKVLKPEEVISFRSSSRSENGKENGFEPLVRNKSSTFYDLEDNLNSRASLPSSVICSLNSLSVQPKGI